jgi:hypothetical protein
MISFTERAIGHTTNTEHDAIGRFRPSKPSRELGMHQTMVRVAEILTFARIKTLAIERATVRIDRVVGAATSRVHQRVGGWLTEERRSPPRTGREATRQSLGMLRLTEQRTSMVSAGSGSATRIIHTSSKSIRRNKSDSLSLSVFIRDVPRFIAGRMTP